MIKLENITLRYHGLFSLILFIPTYIQLYQFYFDITHCFLSTHLGLSLVLLSQETKVYYHVVYLGYQCRHLLQYASILELCSLHPTGTGMPSFPFNFNFFCSLQLCSMTHSYNNVLFNLHCRGIAIQQQWTTSKDMIWTECKHTLDYSMICLKYIPLVNTFNP